jgi:predicted Zn-ribbon and HTH transcriptional regulator
MGHTKCKLCGIRFAHLFSPPRCRQCVSGRTKQMGRPKGVSDARAQKIEATFQAALRDVRLRGTSA